MRFHHWLIGPPTDPLNPINPDNACTLRITAAAGTELAGAYSNGTVSTLRKAYVLPIQKQFTIQRTVFLHAAWLGQSCLHCPIFPTAASRRSLARISVPVWGILLSEPLRIIALVCRYHHQLANPTHAHPYPINILITNDAVSNVMRC